MNLEIFDAIGKGVDVIGKAIEGKKGKGVRRLKAMVDCYLEVVEDAKEDGIIDEMEKELLVGLQNQIVRQYTKLAS